MRHAYLRPRSDRSTGSVSATARGGVGAKYGGGTECGVEIGGQQNADPQMLAVAAHIDELLELLAVLRSPLADMVLQSIKGMTERLKKQEGER
jgi:hypothetical protein